MRAGLGVIISNKCGEPTTEGDPMLDLAVGSVSEFGEKLTFEGSCVRYAYHLDCWDGMEEIENRSS